jgi:hypothetical protein
LPHLDFRTSLPPHHTTHKFLLSSFGILFVPSATIILNHQLYLSFDPYRGKHLILSFPTSTHYQDTPLQVPAMSRSPQPTSADMESASSHNGNAHSSGNDAHATDSSPILTASDGLTASQLSDIAHEYGITSNELASYLQTLPKEYNGIYHMLPYDFCDLPEDRISIPPGPDDLRRIAAMLAATEEIHESPTAHHETYAMADEDNFGGLSYDSGKGRFVEGHVIETTGEMDDLGQEDWKDITDDMELDRSGVRRSFLLKFSSYYLLADS